jgi:hypothetical protein
MIIFNPVIAETNSDDFLSGDQMHAYYKLMELQQNSWIYALLSYYRIGQNLMSFDMRNGFYPGTAISIDCAEVSVYSFGIPATTSEKFIEESMAAFTAKFNEGDSVYWLSETESYPGKEELLSCIQKSDATVYVMPWAEIKNEIKISSNLKE